MSVMDPELSQLKILVADDHLLMRQIIYKAMQERGITRIDLAHDGDVATAMIEKAYVNGEPYHIVFLDWNMPTISGMEVLSYFRAKPAHANTAFVMLTVQNQQSDIMKAIKAGATFYLIKPISPASFIKKLYEIYEWLKSHRRLLRT